VINQKGTQACQGDCPKLCNVEPFGILLSTLSFGESGYALLFEKVFKQGLLFLNISWKFHSSPLSSTDYFNLLLLAFRHSLASPQAPIPID
jgi:hypothetical protein